MRLHIIKLISHFIATAGLAAILVTSCEKGPQNNEPNDKILYTDVIPDSVLNRSAYYENNHFEVDLDHDNSFDYRLIVLSGESGPYLCKFSWEDCEIDSYNNDSVAFNDSGPAALNQNDPIDGSLLWHYGLGDRLDVRELTVPCRTGSYTGNWANVADKFLGLKLERSGLTYYGWIRLTTSPVSVVVKDYAYNSTPNHPILAGQVQ